MTVLKEDGIGVAILGSEGVTEGGVFEMVLDSTVYAGIGAGEVDDVFDIEIISDQADKLAREAFDAG